jgi:NDP-sugar pyrophosphorylase family protein
MKEKISITVDSKILRETESLVDGIKIRNKSQAVEFLLRKILSENRTAVILAGGSEEKLKMGGTLKPLVKVGGKTVIENILGQFKKYKFSNVFIVGRKNVLSEIFKNIGDGSSYDVKISYIEEKGEKSSTAQDSARTLKLLKGKVSTTFICTYCDIMFNYDLDLAWIFHNTNRSVATNLLKTTEVPKKWGVVSVNGSKIDSFVEKPKKVDSYLVYTGIFIAEPEILDLAGSSLEYEIFPGLAKKEMLNGYICSGESRHIHEKR